MQHGVRRLQEKKDVRQIRQQADELISFRMLKGKAQVGQIDLDDDEGQSEMSKALGQAVQAEDLSYRLSRITQLTGLADPVYAEAFVTVHQYDIVLDVLVINQTGAPKAALASPREPQMSVGENRNVHSQFLIYEN